jgi:hypothetical protein
MFTTDSDSRVRRALTVAIALTVLMAAVTGPTTAASGSVGVDTEATDTSTQSSLQAGENRTYNDSQTLRVTLTSDSEQTKLEFNRTGKSPVLAANSSGINTSLTSGTYYMNHSVSHSALADTEHTINSNVSMSFVGINNTSAANTELTVNTWYLEFDDSTSVEYISNADVDQGDIVTVDNESATEVVGLSLPFTGEDKSDIDTTNRNITDNTTVIVALGNTTVFDDFDAVAEDSSSGDKMSSFLSLSRNVVLIEGTDGTTRAAPVYYQEAPDGVESGDTYAVMKQVGGTWSIEAHPGDSFDDANKVSVRAIGSAGLTTFASNYLAASLPMSLFGGSSGVLMLPLFVASRAEPRDWFRPSNTAETEA